MPWRDYQNHNITACNNHNNERGAKVYGSISESPRNPHRGASTNFLLLSVRQQPRSVLFLFIYESLLILRLIPPSLPDTKRTPLLISANLIIPFIDSSYINSFFYLLLTFFMLVHLCLFTWATALQGNVCPVELFGAPRKIHTEFANKMMAKKWPIYVMAQLWNCITILTLIFFLLLCF